MLYALEHGISRNILALQIEGRLFERQVKAKKINNFERTLPQPQTDFVNYLFKDPVITCIKEILPDLGYTAIEFTLPTF